MSMAEVMPRTLQEVLWDLHYAEEREKAAGTALQEARARTIEARRVATEELRKLDGDETAYHAHDRAYMLDDAGCIRSIRLRQAYDVVVAGSYREAAEPTRDFA